MTGVTAGPTTATHPLEPLDESEIAAAVSILRDQRQLGLGPPGDGAQ